MLTESCGQPLDKLDMEGLLAALQTRDVDLIAHSILTIKPLMLKIVQLHQIQSDSSRSFSTKMDSCFEIPGQVNVGQVLPQSQYHNDHREFRDGAALSQTNMPVDLSAGTQTRLSISQKLLQQESGSALFNLSCDPDGSHVDSTLSKKRPEPGRAKLSRFPSKQPTKCNICSKVVRADNFQIHLRSHTGEKPFKCTQCPFRTANPSSMPKHMKLHERGKKVYYCDQCSYSTIYKSNLTAHLRSHPFMSVCSSSNSDSSSPDVSSTSNLQSVTSSTSLQTLESDSSVLPTQAPEREDLQYPNTALDLTIKYSSLKMD